MRIRFAVLVIVAVILGVYYPVLFAGVNSLDDFRMLAELPQRGQLDVFRLFNPVHANGYFRPLTIVSYYIDSSVLQLPAEAMHLENILIHLANTLLVFVVGSMLFSSSSCCVERSFAAAIVFGMHPLNVEAVSWISGRTDLLATLFGLVATLAVFRFTVSGGFLWLWLGALLCLVGSLAKETALFCLPALFIITCLPDLQELVRFPKGRILVLVRRCLVIMLPFLLAGLTYLLCRLSIIKAVFMHAGKVQAISSSTVKAVQPMEGWVSGLLTMYGFYFKKLFLPLPLNFAITSISPYYLWLGLALFLSTIYLVVMRKKSSVATQMLLACLVIMLSAFLISRVGVAWTPYAERYLYLTTAFFAIGIVDAVGSLLQYERFKKTALFLCCCVLFVMVCITAQRALVWQNNLTLYQDTQKKSPDFAPISNELAIALSETSRFDEALRQIEAGKQSSRQGDMPLLYVNQAAILGSLKRYDEAYTALAQSYHGKEVGQAHIEVVKMYIHLMERDRIETKDRKRAARLMSRLAEIHEIYYRRSSDTDHLYRAAQLALAAHDRAKAHRYFIEVAEKAPKESMFKELAGKMVIKTAK